MSKRLVLALAVTCLGVLGVGAAIAVGQGSTDDDLAFAALNGRNEITQSGARGGGDTNGKGSATVLFSSNTRVCYGITFDDIESVAASHIHRGSSTRNGPVVVDFRVEGTDEDPGALSGCVTATRAVVRAIKRNPRNYYVNVHTSDFPGGAIRGQLRR
jgi:CHRD domain